MSAPSGSNRSVHMPFWPMHYEHDAPDVIDATPSPVASRLPPLHLSLQRARPVQPCAAELCSDMRKACSCTALSTYATQPSAPAATSSRIAQVAQRRVGAMARPASHPEWLLLGPVPSDAQDAAGQAAQQPQRRLRPQTSLLTLAQARAAVDGAGAASGCAPRRSRSSCELSRASIDAAPPVQRASQAGRAQAHQRHDVQSGPSQARAAGDADNLRVSEMPRRERAAAMLQRRTALETPFTHLKGLPPALHQEACDSGFHRPVRVKVQRVSAGARTVVQQRNSAHARGAGEGSHSSAQALRLPGAPLPGPS